MALGADYLDAGSFAWGTQFSNDLDLVVRQKVAIVNSAVAPTLNPTTWTLPALTVYGNVSADQFESYEGLGGYAYMTKGIGGGDDFTVFFGGKRSDTGNCIITHMDGNPLILNSDGSAGNVGIGAAPGAYRLDVSGAIRATGGVFYGGDPATPYTQPDYVFEKGYKALKTEEVERYIREKKHLPWMTPSNKEDKGVINMARMTLETVETAENLQLQIIEANKKMKELQQEIKSLKAEIKNLKNK
jgi:hypothetical protein